MMRKWLKRAVLAALGLVVAFVLAALAAPQFEARALREPFQKALSEALARDVALGEVHYTLFPVIGLTATNLVIPEDPAFGLEPIAYVTELQAGIHWSSLFRRQIVFSSLRLVEASINLARSDEHGWNAGSLLRQVEARMREQHQAPSLSLRAGRINFRQGTLKSPFFLNTVDLDIDPPSRLGPAVQWSLEASPARTDRSEQGFGRFRSEGRWRFAEGMEAGIADIEIELERSATSEVAILLAGRDLGMQGRISARMRLDGPTRAMALRGRLELEDLDRGGRFGPRGREWVLPFEGDLSLEHQRLEVRTQEAPKEEETPLTILLAADGLLTRPEVEAAFTLNGFPAATFLDIARRLGAETPRGLTLDGTLHGALALPRKGPVNGEVELREAEVRLQSAGPVMLPGATVRMAGGNVELLPATVATPSGATAELAGRWSATTGAFSFQARIPSLPLDELNTALQKLPASAAPAPLRPCREGSLGGNLRYESTPESEEGVWAADLVLQNVVCDAPGLRAPVLLVRAPLVVRGAQWSMRQATVRWSGVDGIASVETARVPARPLRLTIQVPHLEAGQLEDALRLAAERRGSLLDRTLRRQQQPPLWVRERRLEVDVRARQFVMAGEEYERLRLHAFWDGARIDLPLVELQQRGASFSGRGEVLLRTSPPLYRLVGQLERFPLQGARVDASIDMSMSGFGAGLLETMRMAGRLDARQGSQAGGTADWIAACYDYDAARAPEARLRLECIEARDGGEYFTGEEVVTGLERVRLELEGSRRNLVLTWPHAP